jgi:hypothetical protein
MKMEETVCSETLGIKLHTPENNPEESIRPSKQGEVWNQEHIILYTASHEISSDTFFPLMNVRSKHFLVQSLYTLFCVRKQFLVQQKIQSVKMLPVGEQITWT